jgi:hypothetical protein
MPIGEEGLGEYARDQLDAARRDRRLERGHGAMIDDFGLAVEEVERTRMMSQIGLLEIRSAYRRERERFESEGGDHERESDVQVFWQRAAFATAESDHDHPAINAQALIALNSALDALVEYLAPAVRDLPFQMRMQQAEAAVPRAAQRLTPEIRQALIAKMQELLEVEKPKRLEGKGVVRYERRLKAAGLDAPEDRPIPADLGQALAEFGVIRDCLIHRAGRIDARALRSAHSLSDRYEDGDLIRLGGEDYRTYSAAIRCYAAEVISRLYARWPDLSDPDGRPDLENWRACDMSGA